VNVRRPTFEELPEVLALMQAADEVELGESDWTEGELREHWAHLDLSADAWLVELDGRLGGYADFEHRGAGRMLADGYVHPSLRGQGVGAALLTLTEERARELLPELEGRAYLQNATIAEASALYEPRGYRPVRSSRRMLTELDAEPELTLPPGVEVRPLRPEEARAAHALVENAFADHWEHRARTFEEYAERMFHREDFDPSLCRVAVADGVLAGISLNGWKRHGDWGWIDVVGVRRAFRRRGIGEALVRGTFAEFFRRGERRVALGVDGQNETGAVRLYERLGMRTLWEAVVWEKELRPA
jgi:mycothiol synthase